MAALPPPSQPAVDPETGKWTDPWWRYLSETNASIVSLSPGGSGSAGGIRLVDTLPGSGVDGEQVTVKSTGTTYQWVTSAWVEIGWFTFYESGP